MKMGYDVVAKLILVLFSLVWVVMTLKAFFVVGFSFRMLQNPSFSLLLLGALIIPIGAVWGLYIYFCK